MKMGIRRICRLKRPGDEGGKTAGPVLKVSYPGQVFKPFLNCLDMAEHHGGCGAHPLIVGRLHHPEPLVRRTFPWG